MADHALHNGGQAPAPGDFPADLPLVEILRSTPHLAGILDAVGQHVLHQIEPALSYFGVPAGTVLFREGEAGDDAYVLVSGRVGIFVGGEAKPGDKPLAQIGAGEIFGEMSLISPEPRSATVIALRDSDLVCLPRTAFGRMVQSSSEASLLLMHHLVNRLRHTSHVHASASNIETIALVSLAGADENPWFGRALIEALAEARPTSVIDGLNSEQPQRGAVVRDPLDVYLSQEPESAWTRHCIRQADRVIFAAEADSRRIAIDHPAIAYAATLHRAADLVLINPATGASATGGGYWLDAFPSEHIVQVRQGSGGDIRRVARLALGRTIGLVLSGGGARGFAHVGVYRAFCEAGLPIDLVGGTSMGAMVAALIALDLPPDEVAARLRAVFVAKNPVNDYTLPVVALSRGRKFNRLLRQYYGEGAIEDLWKGFFCVSADLSTGQTVVHRSGSLWQALRATGAIPGIVPPLVESGHVLVDGGIMHNFPTEVMRAQHRGMVVGVEVASGGALHASEDEIEERSTIWLPRQGRKQMPSILRILMRCGTVNGELQSVASRAAADLLIQPDLTGVDMLSFKSFHRAADAGYRAGAAAVPEVRQLLDKGALGRSSA